MNWREELENNVCSVSQLKRYVNISTQEERRLEGVVERHPMSITRYYLSLIDWDDPKDPIRKMAVPSLGELNLEGSYDTSGEQENTKFLGLQHKYSQTALVLATSYCAMYCRHCFRKRMVGHSNSESLDVVEKAAQYIQDHEEINNILITGGDPLMLPTDVLKSFLEILSPISHLDFIRFGTRIPVTFPQRIVEDDELMSVLEKYSKDQRRIYIVAQFNHPREITESSTEAIARLLQAGVVVNNQSVLLRDVNDDPGVLAELQNKLVGIGANPYYVFQCRPVKRVKNSFQVPLAEGYRIIEETKSLLNGHSKRFKYVMSTKKGKVEILGMMDNEMYFKFHQAKNPRNMGKFFKRPLNETAGWLNEMR